MKLLALAAAWIVGLLVGLETGAHLPALVLFSLAALILACFFKSRGLPFWPALLSVVLLMGLIRVEAAEEPAPLKPSDGRQPITLRGHIVSDPEISGLGVEFIISDDAVDSSEGVREGMGRVLVVAGPPSEMVRTRKEPYFRYGDVLELVGNLEEPPVLEGFDYRTYLANQGIHAIMRFPRARLIDQDRGNPAQGFIYRLRRKVSEGIDRALPEPQASLSQALLLGLRGRLPQDVTEDFRSTGTSHLLAISGLHVGTILALSLGAGVWLMGRRRRLYLLLPLGAIWLYALLSGLSPSVERAAIMGSIYLIALALGRPRSILPALALTASVMAGLEPQALKDVSFQLSFVAVAGIALFTQNMPPHMTSLGGRFLDPSAGGSGWMSALARGVMLAVIVSLGATLATLPLIAFNFHQIPTLGIPATILALPALPFLLMTSVVAGVAGLVHPMAGQVTGWVAWVPLEYVIRLVHLFAQVPGSVISVPAFSSLLVWVYYAAFALLLLFPDGPGALRALVRRIRERERERTGHDTTPQAGQRFPGAASLVLLVGLSVLSAFLWFYAVTGPDGKLHVHFLDVGQGDSVLIVTAQGKQVLVDGGPRATDAARAIGSRVPFWDRDLDMLVLTHPDRDHFRGLIEVLDRYESGVVLKGGTVSENPLYLEWEKAVEEEEARQVTAARGQIIGLDGSTWLEVLNPSPRPTRGALTDSNNDGLVLRLVSGEVSFLLTADIEAEAEARLLRGNLPIESTVLKVPHHGSRTSTTRRFLSAVSPVAAVISASADNQYGHPHEEVTGRLETTLGEAGTYLTSERGDIEFITDGKRLWVKTER